MKWDILNRHFVITVQSRNKGEEFVVKCEKSNSSFSVQITDEESKARKFKSYSDVQNFLDEFKFLDFYCYKIIAL